MIGVRMLQFATLFLLTFGVFYLNKPDDLSWWGDKFPILNYLLVVVLTLSGIVFGCLFRQIAGKKGSMRPVQEIKRVFSSRSFWSALCVAPIVFGSTFTPHSLNQLLIFCISSCR